MLGILGDGPDYGADRTVRDRDTLRTDVLQSLGWNLFRLWSVDWALDRQRTEKRLLDTLEKLKADPSARSPDDVVYREIVRRLGYATMSPKARGYLESVLGGSR